MNLKPPRKRVHVTTHGVELARSFVENGKEILKIILITIVIVFEFVV